VILCELLGGGEINMASIHHQIEIDAPITKVYGAISSSESIGTWWDKQTPVQTEQNKDLFLSIIPNQNTEL
jgi:uncharacterized protein YndB with AHSA1/START domain